MFLTYDYAVSKGKEDNKHGSFEEKDSHDSRSWLVGIIYGIVIGQEWS